MPSDVRLHRLALREYRQARDRYARSDPAVAHRFVDAVDRALNRIAQDPESLPIHRQHYRRIRVRKFPYVAYFRSTTAHSVMVVALAHTSRRPDYWIRRKLELN